MGTTTSVPKILSGYRTQGQFIILPPSEHVVPGAFLNQHSDRGRRELMLAEVQRFRGKIYLKDGAITPHDLTADGRHHSPVDDNSWHVLSLDGDGHVCACMRFLEEGFSRGFDELQVRHAAAARLEHREGFRRAVEGEISIAREMGVRFGEVGGWAVAENHRLTTEPLRIVLATCGFLDLLGGCVGVATATWRHRSAAILRRIGMTALAVDGAALPPYYDPSYNCQMEVLRFDTRTPNPRYRYLIQELTAKLAAAPVICSERKQTKLPHILQGLAVPVEGTLASQEAA